MAGFGHESFLSSFVKIAFFYIRFFLAFDRIMKHSTTFFIFLVSLDEFKSQKPENSNKIFLAKK